MKTKTELHAYARRMTLNPSATETKALLLLEQHYQTGIDFRFQEVAGFYILDFVFPSRALVIELDGKSHQTKSAKYLDLVRDRYCKAWGLTVVRIGNSEVATILNVVSKYPELIDGQQRFLQAIVKANEHHTRAISRVVQPKKERTGSRPDIGQYYKKRALARKNA